MSGAGRASAASVQDRRQRIAEIVAARGSISIDELAEATAVSRMTAYRDVGAMQRAGLLGRLVSGIVSSRVAPAKELSTTLRLQRETKDKQAIARAAAERVRPGSAVLVDDSSTALLAVRELAGKPLTIITNSMLVAAEVRQSAAVELIVTGGQYDPVSEALVGANTIESLSTIQADVALIGAVAVDAAGAYHSRPELAEVRRAMIRAARNSMLLIDHTKWQEKALHRFAAIGEFSEVVVDSATGDAERAHLAENGVTIVAPADWTCPHCACLSAGLGFDGVRYLPEAERSSLPAIALAHLESGRCPHCDAEIDGSDYFNATGRESVRRAAGA